MKEVKFRGKRTDNGEWVYGNLVQMETSERYGKQEVFSNTWIVEIAKELETRAFSEGCSVWANNDFIQVDPKTVGEYTGLKDKNGKEIFEGDILQSQHGQNGRVTWDESRLTYIVIWSAKTSKFAEEYDSYLYQALYRSEVIGNIYENPELLETK